MPVFRLEPNEDARDAERWSRSAYRGACLVSAEDGEAARRYADAAYVETGREGEKSSPWMDEGLVACRAVAATGEPPPLGWVRNQETGLVTDAKTGRIFHPEGMAGKPTL